jgi:hypothetical protein
MPLYPSTADLSTYKVGPGRLYTTIQSALDAIGNATSAADFQSPKLIVIAGGVYDEDLTIPLGRILTLQAEGTVILGNGLGSNWSSTNTRNITADYNSADIFSSGARPALNIVAVPSSDATSTFLAQGGSFIISGGITITGGLTRTLNLHSVKLTGALTDASLGLTNLLAYRSLFIGAISAPKAIIARAEDCEFQALVTVLGYNALIDCEIAAGMTVTANENTLPPSGMFSTSFTGVFTGPANSLKVDATSDYFFRTNGATLGGSATRILLASNASATVTGSLSSTDWSTFNSKQNALTLTNLTDAGTDGITITNGTGAVVGSSPVTVSQHIADTTHNGYLSSTDWNTFNSKQSTLTIGNLTDTGTDGITVTNGTGAVIGTGVSISQHVADATHNGYLSSADWNTFSAGGGGGGITALTGDGTATGPGSAALTLATVNSNVGSFGSTSSVATFTVNAKGLTTAAGSTSIQIAESQVTNLSTDLAGKQVTLVSGTNIKTVNSVSVLGSGDLPAGYLTPTWALAVNVDATVGTNKANPLAIPFDATITKAFANAKTGPTGASIIFDINLNSTSIWNSTQANRLTISAGATAGTQTSFDTVTVTAGDVLTIDIDQVGSTVAGQSLTALLLMSKR